MRNKGFHLRPISPFNETFLKAKELNANCLQTFVVDTNRLLSLDETDIKLSHKLAQDIDLYIHGSYWICPTYNCESSVTAFKKEYERSLALGAKLFILHLGSAKKYQDKNIGIEQAVKFLNKITKNIIQNDCMLLIENTAHKNFTVGSDLTDFKTIYNMLDKSDQIGFCFDTSHAHAYGYNIKEINNQAAFLKQLFIDVPFQMKLIHLNDTNDEQGSCLDRHEMIGNGQIGLKALKNIIDILPNNLPIILEAPVNQLNIKSNILERF